MIITIRNNEQSVLWYIVVMTCISVFARSWSVKWGKKALVIRHVTYLNNVWCINTMEIYFTERVKNIHNAYKSWWIMYVILKNIIQRRLYLRSSMAVCNLCFSVIVSDFFVSMSLPQGSAAYREDNAIILIHINKCNNENRFFLYPLHFLNLLTTD